MSEYWIEKLLKQAQSRNIETRERAEDELRALSDEDVEKAVEIVDRWMVRYDRQLARLKWTRPAIVICQFSMPFALIFLDRPKPAVLLFLPLLLLMHLGTLCQEAPDASPSERRKSLLRPLNAGDEHVTAARLIDRLGYNYPDRETALQLEKLLARLDKDSLTSISEAHRRRLYNHLVLDNIFFCPTLMFAILDFVERTGDVEAHFRVKTMAESPAVTSGAKGMRERARQCLATLEPLIKDAKMRDSLLRPSDSPREATLLRPAGESASQSELLLRATNPHDS